MFRLLLNCVLILFMNQLFSVKCQILLSRGNICEFKYETNVIVHSTFLKANRTLDYKFTCDVQITNVPISGNDTRELLKLKLSNIQLAQNAELRRDKSINNPDVLFYMERLSDGTVDRIHIPQKTDISLINVMKGIAGLLSISNGNEDVREVDTSGDCQIKYRSDKSADGKVKTITKEKFNCLNTNLQFDTKSVNDLFSVKKTSNIVSKFEFKQHEDNAKNYFLFTATSNDKHTFVPIIDTDQGFVIVSDQNLVYSQCSLDTQASTDPGPTVEKILISDKQAFKDTFLLTSMNQLGSLSIEDFEKLLHEELKELASETPARLPALRSFSRLLDQVRRITDAEKLTELLDKTQFADIRIQLLDLYVACQTGACINAAMQYIDFAQSENEEIHEHFLFVLSYITAPSEQMVAKMIKLIKESRFEVDYVKAQALSTLGSLVGNFIQTGSGKYSDIINDFGNYFINGINECTEDKCIISYVTGIKNSEIPIFVEPLLNILTKQKNTTVQLQCNILTAIKKIKIPKSLKEMVASVILRIFNYPPLPSDDTVLLIAFDILLKLRIPETELVEIVYRLRNNTHLVIPVMQKIDAWCEMGFLQNTCDEIKSNLEINNYYRLSRPTISRFEYGLLGESLDLYADFQLTMLATEANIVKTSQMDVNLVGTSGETSLMSVELFATGLESIVDDQSSGSNEPPSAGMVISVLGKSLRPVIFFTGQSGLMSAVWNAPSTPTPVLQGQLLFMEFQTALHLTNGLVISVSSTGVASIDLFGSAEVSLWNRNAISAVNQAVGVQLTSRVSFIDTDKTVSLLARSEVQAEIVFDINIEFASVPLTTCFRMKREDALIENWFGLESVQKRVNRNKSPLKRRKNGFKLQSRAPGISYSFGLDNSRTCKAII